MRQPRPWSTVNWAIVLASVCLCPISAFADETVDEQRLTILFAEARSAFVSGDYAAACPKFEEVVRIKPGLGARIGLGDCYRAQSRLSKAWEVYMGVIDDVPDLMKRAKGSAEQATVQKRGDEARTRIKEIEPRLGWMVLVVPEAVLGLKDLTIQVDGVAVDRVKLGVRLPMDRGEHVVEVAAPGKKTWDKTVAFVEGAELSVTVQPLEEDAPPVKTGPVTTPPKTSNGSTPPVIPTPSTGPDKPPVGGQPPVGDTKTGNAFFSTQRIIGLSVGVVGVGALVAGAAFGARAIDKRDESEAGGHCVGSRCDSVGLPLRQASYEAGNVSTGLFIGGGVALAAGVALFLTAPKRNLPVQASVVLGPSSLYCIGRF